eukprot:990294-Pyramimonas_sp.AAC.1
MRGSLPAPEPSSPRAELYAFLMVLTRTTGDILRHYDYLPLVRGMRQPRAQLVATSSMLDPWVRTWLSLDHLGPGRVEGPWTKSHSTAHQKVQFAIGRRSSS